MGSIATYTSDPDAPAVLLEADREYHDSLSDETLEAAAKGGPGQSARLRGHGGAGRGGSRGAPGPGRHRALASQVRRALRLLRRRRPRLGTGKAHAGRFHPVLPARHRARPRRSAALWRPADRHGAPPLEGTPAKSQALVNRCRSILMTSAPAVTPPPLRAGLDTRDTWCATKADRPSARPGHPSHVRPTTRRSSACQAHRCGAEM